MGQCAFTHFQERVYAWEHLCTNTFVYVRVCVRVRIRVHMRACVYARAWARTGGCE